MDEETLNGPATPEQPAPTTAPVEPEVPPTSAPEVPVEPVTAAPDEAPVEPAQ